MRSYHEGMSGEEEELVLLSESRENKKIQQISVCLGHQPVDLWTLRELALNRGGLVNSDIRCKAWGLLVGLDGSEESVSLAVKDRLNPKEIDLIAKDAKRSVLYRYYKSDRRSSTPVDTPPGELTSQGSLSFQEQQEKLTSLLEAAVALPFPHSPFEKIHYYQGLHDIGGVLMYNLEETDQAVSVLRKICQSHLREAVREHFVHLTWLIEDVFFPLIEHLDAELHGYFREVGVEISNAVLPWIITWFTHDIHDERVASRLIDAFLASHALFPFYMAAALMIHPVNKAQLLVNVEGDPAVFQMTLRKFPNQILSDWCRGATREDKVCAQDLIDDALHYMRQVPPRGLLKLATIYNTNQAVGAIMLKARDISLLKAPPSWALASTIVTNSHHEAGGEMGKENELLSTKRSQEEEEDKTIPTHRAKIASGVTFLMRSVPMDLALSERCQIESVGEDPMTIQIKSLWQLIRRIIFGNTVRKELQQRRLEQELDQRRRTGA